MPSPIAIAVTADVADLTAKMAVARVEVRSTTKTLDDLAKAFAGKDLTDEQASQLLAAGDAAAYAKNRYASLQQQMKDMVADAKKVSDDFRNAAQEMAEPAPSRQAPNTQAIINSNTGVSGDFKSAADSGAVFEAAMGIQAQRAKDVRDAMAEAAVATGAEKTALDAAGASAAAAAPNFQSIINAATGVGRAARSAADSASVFESAMGVQAQRAKDLRDAMAMTTAATDKLASASEAASAAAKTTAPNFQQIINTTTGVSRASRSAADSAAVFEEAMGTQAARARNLREAMGEGERGMVSSRAATEGLVLVHEALSGRYSRMTGSAMIMTQALAGQEAVTAAVNAVMTATGAAVIGTAVALGAATIAAVQYNTAQKQLTVTALGLGAAAGLTARQLRETGEAAATYAGMSNHAATDAAEGFASAGIRSEQTIEQLVGAVRGYAVLTGQTVPDALEKLTTGLRDPIKAADDLNSQLSILDRTQLEQIRNLVEQGNQTQATAVISQALADRLRDAGQAGMQFSTSANEDLQDLKDLWEWFGKAASAAAHYAETLSQGYIWEEDNSAITEAAQRRVQHMAQLNKDSVAGTQAYNSTPEGQDAQRHKKLEDGWLATRMALDADTELRGAHSKAVEQDRQTLVDYQRALDTFIPSADKAHQLAVKDAELASARQSHNKQRIADLTRERETISMAGEVASPDAVKQAGDDAASKAAASATTPKKHDDTVAKWSEQLHQQEIASGDFFRDQTANELAFWQSKLALTTEGSKNWLAVQARIYEANKALAHQEYQEHLAELNERIQADRNNWAQEQADWNEKLAFIKGKYGEQSTEYRNASREWLHAQQQHNEQEFREAQQQAQRMVEALKKNLDTQAKAREDDAKGKEAVIRNNSGNTPFGDVSAEIQIAQIEAQLTQQKIADLDTYQAAKDAQLQSAVDKAKAAFGEEAEAYKAAVQAKADADQQYRAQHQQMDSQQRLQSIQSIIAVQQAYHSYVDGQVSAGVTAADGLISGQKTWAQAAEGLYGSVVRTFEQQVERMVSNWIVQHLLMTTAQRAQLAAQTAAHMGSEVAQTGATVAGTAARTATTVAGAATERAVTSTTNKGAVMSQAATAAASAYKAMAGIPVVGPILGAAAATTTFAAVSAYATLASFDQGVNVLPADMIAQVHAGERIIPAADNAQMISLMQQGAGVGAKGGDMHFHYGPTINGQMPFASQLAAHEGHIVDIMAAAMRRNDPRLK